MDISQIINELGEDRENYFNAVSPPIIQTSNFAFKKVADLHAKTILSKISTANKLLFVDTDLIITKSYAQYLFNKELIVEQWIEEANQFDLYLFMEPDGEYIQDGTRLSVKERNALSNHHKTCFENAGISLVAISGNWEERFKKAITVTEQICFNKKAAS